MVEKNFLSILYQNKGKVAVKLRCMALLTILCGKRRYCTYVEVTLAAWRNARNLLYSNKEKCKVVKNNPGHQYTLGATQVENSLSGKDPVVLVDTKLNNEPSVSPFCKES